MYNTNLKSPQGFHERCDNRGPTVVIIQATNSGKPHRPQQEEGWVFGGYASESWEARKKRWWDGWKRAPGSFLFTITNPHGIPPTKYECTRLDRAMQCGADCGLVFGGCDMVVNSSIKGTHYTRFPVSYADTTGMGSATFTRGTENTAYFTPHQVEVYSVVDC